MIKEFTTSLIVVLILLLNCCSRDKPECNFITIFEEDFESCTTNECRGWSGFYKITTCDSSDLCGDKVMEVIAGWCPGEDPARTYLTGLSENNIIRLTMNYNLNCADCFAGIKWY